MISAFVALIVTVGRSAPAETAEIYYNDSNGLLQDNSITYPDLLWDIHSNFIMDYFKLQGVHVLYLIQCPQDQKGNKSQFLFFSFFPMPYLLEHRPASSIESIEGHFPCWFPGKNLQHK